MSTGNQWKHVSLRVIWVVCFISYAFIFVYNEGRCMRCQCACLSTEHVSSAEHTDRTAGVLRCAPVWQSCALLDTTFYLEPVKWSIQSSFRNTAFVKKDLWIHFPWTFRQSRSSRPRVVRTKVCLLAESHQRTSDFIGCIYIKTWVQKKVISILYRFYLIACTTTFLGSGEWTQYHDMRLSQSIWWTKDTVLQ